MGYWYHYAIMFEALFILTTMDTGTRVARYVLQELMGKVHKPFGNSAWLPGNLATSFLVVLGWGYLIYTGNISTIWPLFGTGNQLLATIALAVVPHLPDQYGQSEIRLDHGRAHVFRGSDDADGGSVVDQEHLLAADARSRARCSRATLDTDADVHLHYGRGAGGVRCSAALDTLVLNGAPAPQEAFGPPVSATGEIRMGCC